MKLHNVDGYEVNLAGIPIFFENGFTGTIPEPVRDDYEISSCNSAPAYNAAKISLSCIDDIEQYFTSAKKDSCGTVKYFKTQDVEHYCLLDRGGRMGPVAFSCNVDKLDCLAHYHPSIRQESHGYTVFNKRVLHPFFNNLYDIFLYSILLSYRSGLIMHGVGVVTDKGKGVFIGGSSGSGKTTLSKKLQRLGYKILNDETVIIRKAQNGVCLFSVPWSGINSN